MSRKVETGLFELIQSLTKGEKRNFKLFANYFSEGEKNYLLLFEIISRQKAYDESTIKRFLKEKKIKKPLAQLKLYLHDLLLKSLRYYHEGNSINSQLRVLLADVELYHQKGLKKLRDKLLGKAKQLASKHEKHDACLTILATEWRYSPTTPNLYDEVLRIMNAITEQSEFRKLVSDTLQLQRKGLIREKTLRHEWDKLMDNPLMEVSRIPDGCEASYHFYWIWMMYHHRMANSEKTIAYTELIIENFKSHPILLKEKTVQYAVALNNFIVALNTVKNTEKAKAVMNQLLQMQELKLNTQERNELNNNIILGYSNMLHGFLHANKLDELGKFTAQIELFLKAQKPDYYYASSLYFNLSYWYLIIGNFAQSTFWNNLSLKVPIAFIRQDVYAYSKMLNLILHYERNNTDLLPYIIRSTYRFLYKRKRLYKTEDVILRFMRNKIPKANTKNELLDFFGELKCELEEITKDPYEAKMLIVFDYVSWLEAKIKNRPFVEVLQEKC